MPSSPYKNYSNQETDRDSNEDQFTLRPEDEIDLFNTDFIYEPQSQLDSDADLVVPASRNDLIYGSSNSQQLQYPPKYDLQTGYFAPSSSTSAASTPFYASQVNDPFSNQPGSSQMYHQQQQQQQQQRQYSQTQQNLYPSMMASPTIVDQDIPLGLDQTSQLPSSYSTSTVSSISSMPQAFQSTTMPSSQSETSLASSMSHQNFTTATPRRGHSRNTSIHNTPAPQAIHTPQLKKTPSTRITKSHRRTRSRLSVDATGIALMSLQPSTSTNNSRSPAPSSTGGTNPFYTSNIYQSPHHDSANTTPLATPSVDRQREPPSSHAISPMMLINQQDRKTAISASQEDTLSPDVFAEAADMTLRMASHFGYSANNPDTTKQQTKSSSSPRRNATTTHRHSASYSFPSEHSSFPTTSSHPYFGDAHNTDFTELTDLTEETTNSTIDSVQSKESFSTPVTTHQRASSISVIPSTSGTSSGPRLHRSQTSIDISSLTNNPKLIPPEITKYDIITPRKQSRLSKSQSTTELPTDASLTSTKKPKKVHSCPLCNAIFQRPEHVKRHMRSHSSEKPFVCDEPGCGKRFNRGDNMKAHLRKIHGRDV
ncbi:Cell wall integrity transcriptional regulator CAS5 [Cyberlindnera fabianii]|nr:Cell wall integrity transcriptional regulator CAS5 [Cyberlindnera fabianii]